MPLHEYCIKINQPPNAVYRQFVDEPETIPQWSRSFSRISRVTKPPTRVGSLMRYEITVNDEIFSGEYEVINLVPDEYTLIKSISGLDWALEVTLKRENDGTLLTARIDLGNGFPANAIDLMVIKSFKLLKKMLEQESATR